MANKRVPLGQLPVETPEDRRALAQTIRTAAGRARARVYVQNLRRAGVSVVDGKPRKVSAGLAKLFYFASKN